MGIRVALLLSGLYDPSVKDCEVEDSEKIPVKYLHHCEHHFRKYVMGPEVDVFIHSYDTPHRERLVEFYKPKSYRFDPPLPRLTCDQHTHPCYNEPPSQCLLSKAFSEKSAIELCRSYEREHNFRYDFCILTRFDVVWFRRIDYQALLSEHDARNVVFHSYWNKLFQARPDPKGFPRRFLEHFVAATSPVMEKYGRYFDYLQAASVDNNSCQNDIFHKYQDQFIKAMGFKTEGFCFRFHDHALLRNVFRKMPHNNYNRECIPLLLE